MENRYENTLVLQEDNLVITYFTNYQVENCRQVVENNVTTITGMSKLYNDYIYKDLQGNIITPTENKSYYTSLIINNIYTRIISKNLS